MKKLVVIVMMSITFNAMGNIRLPAIIGSNMVLQQLSEVRIWGWGDPYEKVTITTSWDHKTYPPVIVDGNAKWSCTIKTPAAGGSYDIEIDGHNRILLTNVLIGEVWVCSGQSNMEMCGNWGLKEIHDELPHAANNSLRFFYIPKRTAVYPQEQGEGHWVVCDSNSLKSFSAVGYFYGKYLNRRLDVPVGLVEASWGGTSAEVWTPGEIVNHDPVLALSAKKIAANGQCPNLPGYAYNAMISPVTSYTIKGVIWYQGENNTINARTYTRLFNDMIAAWRNEWHSDLPFYFVQIAPFEYEKKNVGALLREAQFESSKQHNVGMVVITDLVNDIHNVHPGDKHDVGLRLARWALAKTYHKQGIVYEGPEFESMKIEDGKAIITFAHAQDGLKMAGGTVKELYIAGPQKKFYPALCKIQGDTLIVWSQSVRNPAAVRYGFSNAGIGNLFSQSGLPVGPFRTDRWAVETE